MLKVLLPPRAMEFGGQSRGITGRSPWPTARLRQGTFRCCGWNILCCPGGEITLLTRWLHTHLLWHPLGQLADQPPSPHPLVIGLPWSCELGPPAGAVLSMEGLEVTSLPVDLPGGCTACWYAVAGHPSGD